MTITKLPRGKNGSAELTKRFPSYWGTTPVNPVASEGELTIAEACVNEDTMTIGTTVYTFVTGATSAAGEIGLGANEAATKLAIVKAILGTDGFNTAHPLVTCDAAFTSDTLDIIAKNKGVAGDLIATTETFDGATNVFDAATLGTEVAGVDGTVAGVTGECVMDASYLYYCTYGGSMNVATWSRTACATF